MKNVKIKNDMTSRQQDSVMSRFKVATLSAAVTSLICASIPNTYASDIEIHTLHKKINLYIEVKVDKSFKLFKIQNQK